jgi:hypothetical protein
MNDLMIDIETLGHRPGSVIASIGAIEFDAATGEFGQSYYLTVDPESCQRHGLKIDASTVKWWMTQSEEARASTFAEGISINHALLDLTRFVQDCEPARIWAHSPSFDVVQLEAAYEACVSPCPWTYKQPRDTRTLFDLAGVKIEKNGVHHNAADDARAQAEAVIRAYQQLGLSSPAPQPNVAGLTSPASTSPIRPVEARPEGQHQPDQGTTATSACPQTSRSPVAHETDTERELHAHEDFFDEQSSEPSEGKRRHLTTTAPPQQHLRVHSSRLTLLSILCLCLTSASTRLSDLISCHVTHAIKAINIRPTTRVTQSAPVGPKTATSGAAREYEVTSLIKISSAKKKAIRPIPITLVLNNFLTALSLPLSRASERSFPEAIPNQDSGYVQERKKADACCNLAGLHQLAPPSPQPKVVPLTCQCANTVTDPCIVCGRGKTLVTVEWLQKMAAKEGDLDCTTGRPSPVTNVLPPVVTGQREIEPDVTSADLGVNAEPADDEIGPHEQALRDAVEPFLDWLEMREEGAHIQEVRDGLIGVEDVLPDDLVVLGAHLRADKDQGVLTMGHFRRLQNAYDGNATPSPQPNVLPPVVTGQLEIEQDVTATDLGANAEPDADDYCPACGGSGRVGPFFPGGLSTVCGNCSDTVPPSNVTGLSDEQRGVGIGMAIAAGIVMKSWGNDTYAREILGAAGLHTLEKLKASGVDQYDIDLVIPALAATATEASR